MIEKKTHILSLKFNGREMMIGTDNLREVLSLTGFTGEVISSSQENSDVNAEAYRELAKEQQLTIRKLQEQIRMQRSNEQVVAETRQPGGQQQGRPVSPLQQQSRSQSQMQPKQMLRQQLPEKTVLDTKPEDMNNDIWGQMSSEEQQQWQQRWVPQ